MLWVDKNLRQVLNPLMMPARTLFPTSKKKIIILGQITLTGLNLISTSHLLKSTGNWMEEERERNGEGEKGASHPGCRAENKLGGEEERRRRGCSF